MTKKVNFEAESLIQSQSHNAPFITIFESDNDISIVYAVVPLKSEESIVDQIVFDEPINATDVILRWNHAGNRAGIIVNERLSLIFDFEKQTTFSDQMVPTVATDWSRQSFQFSKELAIEFGIDSFFKQPQLDTAIDNLLVDGSQTNRLLFYKALLTSTLFVPITTASPDDPNSLIYTFPNNIDGAVEFEGNLICAYSNSNVFEQQIGQHGLSYQKISADFLCFQAQSFDDILGITITSASQNSVLLTRDEFKLLALISQPQRLDTPTLLKALGNVFFVDEALQRDRVQEFFKTQLSSKSLVRSAYYCRPNVQFSTPLFCVVLNSTKPSDQLTDIVTLLNRADIQSFCQCHVFSLSDVFAKALESAKQPL
ncbi:MAG: DUF2251 domain-containing protein [Candidatus Margulisiibacteriota bacterium]